MMRSAFVMVLTLGFVLGATALVKGQVTPPVESVARGAMTDANGESFTSKDLREWIDTLAPIRNDMILAFTQCYGANWFGDFEDLTFGTLPSATLIAASEESITATYGGAHVGFGKAMKPGNTTNDMSAEGAKTLKGNDTVRVNGLPRLIGGPHSTHIIIWAAKPNGYDAADIARIKDNFKNDPNAVITVLCGSADEQDKEGNTISFAATKQNLKMAIAAHGAVMALSHGLGNFEQFDMFFTDHGDMAVQEKQPQGQVTPVFPTKEELDKMPPEERAKIIEEMERFKQEQRKENERKAKVTMDTPVEDEGGQPLDQAAVEARIQGMQIMVGSHLVWDEALTEDTYTITEQYLPEYTTDTNGNGVIDIEDTPIWTFDGCHIEFEHTDPFDPLINMIDLIDPWDTADLTFIHGDPVSGLPLPYDSAALHLGPTPKDWLDLAGDFNGDGAVDAEDLALLLGNWGQSVQPDAWFTHWDGFVDANELAAVLANWGAGLDAVPVLDTAILADIPEPTTIVLLVLLVASLPNRRGMAAHRRCSV